MKKLTILPVLAIGLAACCLTAQAQTLNFTNSANNAYIVSIANGESYAEINGSTNIVNQLYTSAGTMLTGNPNAANFDYETFFKIDIDSLAGETISSATLNLAESSNDDANENYSLAVLNFDEGSGAFSDSENLNSVSNTVAATFTTNGVTKPWIIPINVTSEVQAAINDGFDYVTFKLYNNETGSGIIANNYQTWSYNSAVGGTGSGVQNLVIVTSPEPSTVSMLIVAALGLSMIVVRRRQRA